MNKTLTNLLLFSLAVLCQAQTDEILQIKYNQFMDFDINEKIKSPPTGVSTGEYENALKEAMAKPKYYILNVMGNQSDFYQNFVIDNSQPKEKGAVDIRFGTNTKENHKYKNTETKEYLEESTLNGKKYLVRQDLRDFPWQIEKEEKTVCGIPARKAVFFNDKDSISITAWYATKLNYKHGPENYWGLPGIILYLNLELKKKNYSALTAIRYECTSVDVVTDFKNKMIRPNKGEIISNEDFWKKVRENQQKHEEMYSSGIDKD